jgi:hypothetical protein
MDWKIELLSKKFTNGGDESFSFIKFRYIL